RRQKRATETRTFALEPHRLVDYVSHHGLTRSDDVPISTKNHELRNHKEGSDRSCEPQAAVAFRTKHRRDGGGRNQKAGSRPSRSRSLQLRLTRSVRLLRRVATFLRFDDICTAVN